MQDKNYAANTVRRRRALGYISRVYHDAVSGGDSGYTLYKAGIIMLIATGVVIGVVSGFAIPIIIAAAVTIPFYVASGIIDEHERNEKETKKIQELEELNRELTTIQDDLNQTLGEDINLNLLTKEQLLKWVLRNYLRSMGLLDAEDFWETLNKKKKANGNLPSRESILRLIESVTGLDREDKNFAGKLKYFLTKTQVPGLNEGDNFDNKLIAALKFSEKPKNGHQFVEVSSVPYAMNPSPKKKTLFDRVKRFGKNTVTFFARFNTAAWLVFGSSVLLGFIILGTPVSWPIIAVGITLATVSGIASLVYTRYADHNYKKTEKQINDDTKEAQTRFELLHKLNKHHQKRYDDLKEYDETKDHEAYLNRQGFRPATSPAPKASTSTTVRTKISTISQVAFGFSTGMLIGAGLAALTLLLVAQILPPIGLPLLMITIAGASVGGFYGVRYGYMKGKKDKREGEKEIKREENVAKSCQKLERRFKQLNLQGGKELIKEQLAKSKQQLVNELLEAFIDYKKSTYGQLIPQVQQDPISKEILTKNEKILLKIEAATGIKRSRQVNGLPDNNDSSFYDQLALYLQQDKALAANVDNVNLTVGRFKAVVLGKKLDNGNPPLDCIVDPQKPSISRQDVKSGLRTANRFAIKHIYPLLGALGVAFPVAFVLFGPAALIPIVVTAAVILTAYTVVKVCEYRANKNKEKLASIEEKLPLIEAIATTNKKTHGNIKQPIATSAVAQEVNGEKLATQKQLHSETENFVYKTPLSAFTPRKTVKVQVETNTEKFSRRNLSERTHPEPSPEEDKSEEYKNSPSKKGYRNYEIPPFRMKSGEIPKSQNEKILDEYTFVQNY